MNSLKCKWDLHRKVQNQQNKKHYNYKKRRRDGIPKVCKQFWNDIKVILNIQSSIPTSFYITGSLVCKMMLRWGFVYSTSLFISTLTVYILSGMPSLHLFTFLMFFFFNFFSKLFHSHCTEAFLSASRHGPMPSF